MADIATICNAALQMVKNSKTITGLTQGTKEANACAVCFEELRDALLEMHTWKWAKKRVKLAQLTETPEFGWQYAYEKPADFIRAVSVHRGSAGTDNVPYSMEGTAIYADCSDLYLSYVRRVTDPNEMSPNFRSALAKLLASRLAVALVQSPSLSKELYDQFLTQDLPTAKGVDSIQNYVDQFPESDWVTVRNGGFTGYRPGTVDE